VCATGELCPFYCPASSETAGLRRVRGVLVRYAMSVVTGRCPDCGDTFHLPVEWDDWFDFRITATSRQLRAWFAEHVAESAKPHYSPEILDERPWVAVESDHV